MEVSKGLVTSEEQTRQRMSTTEENLMVPKLSHTGKSFACSLCDKVFSRSSVLKRHNLSHTGEKQFGCTQCGKAFSTSSDLIRHKFSHTGEKQFGCTQCGKAFSRSSILKDHKLSHNEG